jgi:endonuclease YncB( thermonuclease family)
LKTITLIIFLSYLTFCAPAFANLHEWKVIRVIDGDTIEVEAPFLPKELKLFVRVLGIDTPEKGNRAKCKAEADLAIKASKFTESFFKVLGNKATFSDIKWDKFGGRVLANVVILDNNLAKELIHRGYARIYNGEKKKSWCSGKSK